MPIPRGSKTRLQIRQAVGYNLGSIVVSTVSATGDTFSLIDTYGLAKGGSNDYKGRQIQINTATQSAIVGQKRFIVSSDAANKIAILSPALSAATTALDTYEMWTSPYSIEETNDKINQAIVRASADILQDKETHTTVKEADKYEYDCLSSFVGLHTVEYISDTKIDKQLHACDVVWDELVDGDVTASVDEDNQKEGTGCLNLAVGASAGATDKLATDAITSVDLNDCDELLIWIFSSIALSAGDLQVLLDDTALCASALESLNIPATSANTWTRHIISLANPATDIDIISIGIKMITNLAAFTLKVDDIRAQNSKSRIWKELSHNLWTINQAATPLLKLSPDGYACIADTELMRLTGYAIPAELSADATSCEIDPDFVIAYATAGCLASHAGSSQIDVEERLRRSDWWMGKAEGRLRENRTQLRPNTRFLNQ